MIKYKVVDGKLAIGYLLYYEEHSGNYVAVIRRIDSLDGTLNSFAQISWFGWGYQRISDVRRFQALLAEAVQTAVQIEGRYSVEDFRLNARSS